MLRGRMFLLTLLTSLMLTTICRADGTTRRGRGKGRGGSTRGRTSGASKAVPAVRKPRVTKAARVLMEQEKAQRESMAILAAKPTGYPG